MTLQGLRCFAAVAKHSSYAEAARQLYISQPAITRHIQLLEQELDTRLLDRNRSLVRLTPVGTLFYSDVMRILEQLDLSVKSIQNSTHFTEMLSIGCESTIQLSQLPRIYREFQQCCPNVYINNSEIPATERKKLLRSGQLDIVFFSKAGIDGIPGIKYTSLFRGQFCCVLPKEHPLTSQTEIGPADLTGETLILIDSLHCPPEMEPIQEELRRECKRIRLYLSSSSIATVSMILGGLGIAVMPNYVCPDVQELSIVPYHTSQQVEYGLAWHSGDVSPKIKHFIRIARQVYGTKN